MVDKKSLDFKVIDDDFDTAARFYCSTATGGTKDAMKEMLLRKYNDDDIIDSLVFLFGQYRHHYGKLGAVCDTTTQTPAAEEILPEGFKLLSGLVTELINQMDPAERRSIEEDVKKMGTVVQLVTVKCTCLSELAHDAYGPGGPSSGQPLPPPCKIHKR